jgi:hypothetical protein
MALIRFVLLTAVFAMGTAVAGWWAVPLLGAAWGWTAARTRRPAMTAAIAAGLAWGSLLLWTASAGPAGKLVTMMGTIADVPGAVFVVATLVLPVLLAGLSARVVRRS